MKKIDVRVEKRENGEPVVTFWHSSQHSLGPEHLSIIGDLLNGAHDLYMGVTPDRLEARTKAAHELGDMGVFTSYMGDNDCCTHSITEFGVEIAQKILTAEVNKNGF